MVGWKPTWTKMAGERNPSKPTTLHVGSRVLMRQGRVNKLPTPFDPQPYIITKIKGTMITAELKQANEPIHHSRQVRRVPAHLAEFVQLVCSDTNSLWLTVESFQTECFFKVWEECNILLASLESNVLWAEIIVMEQMSVIKVSVLSIDSDFTWWPSCRA